MKPQAIQQARDRLQAATDAVAAFRAATDFPAAERAWRDFLLAMGGIYSKLEQGAKGSGRSEAWFGRKKHERKKDELLRYLHFARNADEHGLKPVTDRHPGQRGPLGPTPPFGQIRRMSVYKLDQETLQPTGQSFPAYVAGPGLALTRAHDDRFGDFCDPPRSHNGQDLTNPLTESAPAAALAYGALMIAEAEALL